MNVVSVPGMKPPPPLLLAKRWPRERLLRCRRTIFFSEFESLSQILSFSERDNRFHSLRSMKRVLNDRPASCKT
jgi:hypothetical protein